MTNFKQNQVYEKNVKTDNTLQNLAQIYFEDTISIIEKDVIVRENVKIRPYLINKIIQIYFQLFI